MKKMVRLRGPVEMAQIITSDTRDCVRALEPAVCRDGTRLSMCVLHVTEGAVVATDGRRLHYQKREGNVAAELEPGNYFINKLTKSDVQLLQYTDPDEITYVNWQRVLPDPTTFTAELIEGLETKDPAVAAGQLAWFFGETCDAAFNIQFLLDIAPFLDSRALVIYKKSVLERKTAMVEIRSAGRGYCMMPLYKPLERSQIESFDQMIKREKAEEAA